MARAQVTGFWIGTSWKMNKTRAEALDYARSLRAFLDGRRLPVIPFVIPPFTVLRDVAETLTGSAGVVGAQNMHWADAGAWTGEISPLMLKDCGASLVEIGHSERRTHFGETDETVGRKVAAALHHRLTPLVCVGETLAERKAGLADEVLARQVEHALGKIEKRENARAVLFAYEPVWSIGEGGIPATPDYADGRQALIKAVAERASGRVPPVLYGGSVNPENCEALFACPKIDGLFIGRAAWDAESYIDILRRCAALLESGPRRPR